MTRRASRFRVVPLTIEQANALVRLWHRHSAPVLSARFALGLVEGGDSAAWPAGFRLVGAAIVGRPLARAFDQYRWAEVLRLVTDGTEHACSALYGASAQVAREMGFEWLVTYTLDEESGASLRASGWTPEAERSRGGWATPARPDRAAAPTRLRRRWMKQLNPPAVFEMPAEAAGPQVALFPKADYHYFGEVGDG